MTYLDACRRAFAQELREVAHLESDALVDAFAKVPRERYLGPGPWKVLVVGDDGKPCYRLTESSDAALTYCNAVIAIEPARRLHNGEPGCVAMWIDRLQLRAGETVVQIGCGTDYYTAILAEVVGPTGRVVTFQVDVSLAARAKANLNHLARVEVLPVAWTRPPPAQADAMLVNCGVTQPPLRWLDCLRNGGRLVLPITASPDETGVGTGAMFLITREEAGVSIQQDSTCWLYSEYCCLSRAPLHADPRSDPMP